MSLGMTVALPVEKGENDEGDGDFWIKRQKQIQPVVVVGWNDFVVWIISVGTHDERHSSRCGRPVRMSQASVPAAVIRLDGRNLCVSSARAAWTHSSCHHARCGRLHR